MAITNYAELQTAISGHLRRGDLAAQIPDFIALGEARLNRKLRLLKQETTAQVTLSTVERFADLPARFLEAISLSYADGSSLIPVSAERMNGAISSVPSLPTLYRISERIEFDCVANQAYILNLRMFKRWDIATDSTNWLLTNCPDCYLYAALLAASPYIKDDGRMEVWKQLLIAAIDEANEADDRTRSNTILTTDEGMGA